MFVVAANFTTYWGLVQAWQTIIFYILCPLAILAINWLGVKVWEHRSAFVTNRLSKVVANSFTLVVWLGGRDRWYPKVAIRCRWSDTLVRYRRQRYDITSVPS